MPTIKTLGRKKPFHYEGSIGEGVTIQFPGGNTPVSAALFEAILGQFGGQTIPGGFSFDNPTPGGLGEWVQEHSSEFNSRALTPKHASHIAAILVRECNVGFSIDGNAVWLHFP